MATASATDSSRTDHDYYHDHHHDYDHDSGNWPSRRERWSAVQISSRSALEH